MKCVCVCVCVCLCVCVCACYVCVCVHVMRGYCIFSRFMVPLSNISLIVWFFCVNNRGIDLKGETLGTAFNGMMCDSHKSVGLIQDRLSSTEEIGSQASHELGHILNMAHDNGRKNT